jgi:hypothetical protein
VAVFLDHGGRIGQPCHIPDLRLACPRYPWQYLAGGARLTGSIEDLRSAIHVIFFRARLVRADLGLLSSA